MAQSYTPLLTYNETNTTRGSASASVHRVRRENENYLETFFSPDTIPTLSIPVLENALGNLVPDGVVNILDLLRLRDITIVRPPTPSPYELGKGDLNRDGKIDVQDLNILRDILLHKASVPYLVDSTGGKVLGDGITLTLPPGAVDSTIIISIKRNSESEFAQDMGVDTKGAIQDSAYFMASFEITSSTLDFKLPVGATIKLDSIPPCAYQGLNGLFAAVPDRDGDGKSELFLINELNLIDDSLTITTANIPISEIQSLSASSLEPGQSLTISGSGFGELQNTIVRIIPIASPESLQNVIPEFVDDSTIIVILQSTLTGNHQIIVQDRVTGLSSNPQSLEVLPPSPVVGDIRSIILSFYHSIADTLDSIPPDSLFGSVEDTTVRGFLTELHSLNRTQVDSEIVYFSILHDSLINDFASFAAFLQNMIQQNVPTQYYLEKTIVDNRACKECSGYRTDFNKLKKMGDAMIFNYHRFARLCIAQKRYGICNACQQAEINRIAFLRLSQEIADLFTLWVDCICRCKFLGDCDKCKKTVYVGYGPNNQQVSGGYGEGGFGTRGTCVNIIRYKRNECVSVTKPIGGGSPVPIEQLPLLKCPEITPSMFPQRLGYATINFISPSSGSIIKITNVPVPYNIVGIMNDNGNAFIPHVPLNTKITFSIYDPVSGLYDPDAGTYTTGSVPGGFDRPILLFRPNTSIRNFAVKIGDLVHDSITLDMQRIDYSLNIGAADTSKLLNIGLSATKRLSFHIEDPDGIILFDNMDISCYMNSHVRFNKIGRYYIRVALGVSAQPGQFYLGITVSPSKPLPSSCLCDDIIVDTLFEELSPYEVLCPATIASGDTIVSEAGVILEFSEGGIINANGPLIGTGSPMKPITLKELQTDKRKSLSIGDKIKNGTQRRKEVEP